jgi:hypothetical protein
MNGWPELKSSASLLVCASDTKVPARRIRPGPQFAATTKFVFTNWAAS